ncbi:5-oxoprolinase subunit B family protein [Amycolatopsis sp. CA-126428]|uniref:5-oxoprolinase subunit B family protein n=1 Tax=Amycolatopsis sp. CA-126428 TaxID=2073158 RepID=UPI000CD2718B|nr:allophanate hydrolase subunit 1 [Amycolatopsis sp. CA-126428]
MTVRLLPCGRRAVLVELDDVLGFQAALTQSPPDGVVELVPAARTLLVRFDPSVTNAERLGALLRQVSPVDRVAADAGEVVIPVVYDGEDLADVAAETGLSVASLISRHTAGTYVSAFCGFAPGFAYLTGSDPALHVPRRSSPRTRIPAGSVAIAGEYSAVYPSASPGGWRLLGRTEVPVWDVERDPPNLLPPGTRVRFTAVAS